MGKLDKGDLSLKAVERLRPVVSEKVLSKLTKKAKTKRGERHLKAQEPQVHEDTKTLLLLRGHRTGQRCLKILQNMCLMRKPHALYLNQRNQTKLMFPLEDPSDFEYLGTKNESSLFMMSSSTKKHPCRIFGGRLYNHKLYDLLEFDVLNFSPFKTSKGIPCPNEGSKPLVLFQGVGWELNNDMLQAKNYFADVFGGYVVDKILLTGFDHAWVCVAYEEQSKVTLQNEILIQLKHFHIALKKDPNSKLPALQLTDIGPDFTLRLGKTRLPEKAAVKAAMKLPAEEVLKKKKNQTTTDLTETRAKVYINKEDLSKLHTPHGH